MAFYILAAAVIILDIGIILISIVLRRMNDQMRGLLNIADLRIGYLEDMLKAHFGIKYDLNDFTQWQELHPNATEIPVTEGERIHYAKVIGRDVNAGNLKDTVSYRGLPVVEEK